jgi:hypothetical protein
MRSRFWAPLGVALAIGGLVSAVSVRPLSLQELSSGSDDIVYAKVNKVESYWKDQKIETRVTLAPYETWKGPASQLVQVTVPGGTVGNITMRCSEAPTFHEADDVVCFLRNRDGGKHVYGWFRGQYTVVGGRVREMQNVAIATFRATVQSFVPVTETTGGSPR